jgi:hypothetical protein
MKKIGVLLIIVFLLISFPRTLSKNIAIGVSPSIVDLGKLERGSSELARFHVISPSEDTLLVYLDVTRGTFDFFNRDHYREFSQNYSEQNSINWLKILNNPVEMRRTDEPGLLEGNVKTLNNIDLIVEVPEDAESGYHIISVVPSPSSNNDVDDQVSTQVVAVSPVRVILNIPGRAVRGGKILDITSGGIVANKQAINIHFLNTGTVTISAMAKEVVVKDEEENLIYESTSNIDYIKPGEIKTLKAYLPLDVLENKTYNVFARVDYKTGFSDLNSIVDLETSGFERISGKVEKAEPKSPLFVLSVLIAIIILIIIILYYRWYRK